MQRAAETVYQTQDQYESVDGVLPRFARVTLLRWLFEEYIVDTSKPCYFHQ